MRVFCYKTMYIAVERGKAILLAIKTAGPIV